MGKTFLTWIETREISTKFIDCRFQLSDPEWGKRVFDKGHIPGAVYADLDMDLSGPVTSISGRHPLPDLTTFEKWIRRSGFSKGDIVVVYDNLKGGLAARMWWMLKQVGFEKVYIVNESLEEWKSLGFDLETSTKDNRISDFSLNISSWDEGLYEIKNLEEISLIVPSNYLIDSRAEERYLGTIEPYDIIAGHIPGALNLPWGSHFYNEKLSIKSEKIADMIDISDLSEYTVYCGSGVTACFNLAVFEELNLPRPKLYIGSYSEWSRNHPDRIES